MDAFLSGFTDELVKLGAKSNPKQELQEVLHSGRQAVKEEGFDESLLSQGRSYGKNYLAATLLGAMGYPLIGLASRKAGRSIHNRIVQSAIKATKNPRQRRKLKASLESGPIFGKGVPKSKPGKEPLMTASELGSQAMRGALGGSVVQALKDRFSGEKKPKF